MQNAGHRQLIAGMNWRDQERTLQLNGKGETWGAPSQVQYVGMSQIWRSTRSSEVAKLRRYANKNSRIPS